MVYLRETIHTVSETGGVLDGRIAKVLRSTQQPVLSSLWGSYYEEVSKSAGKDFREFIWNTFLYYEEIKSSMEVDQYKIWIIF